MTAKEGKAMMKEVEFLPGDRVLYVPGHAHGNPKHPDCESGSVVLVTDYCVFVRFAGLTPIACGYQDLRLIARA